MSEPVTLGQRLDRLGRRLVARHDMTPQWSGPLTVLLEHLGRLPSPDGPRFARREAPPGRPVTSAGRALPADVTARLRPVVGEGVEAVRVHDDEAADERARAHRSDAVSVGTDVYFRAGRLRPREPRGFALLVHEATHVVERMRPGAAWRRATGGGSDDEERLARTREAQALAPAPPAVARPAWAPAPPASAGPARSAPASARSEPLSISAPAAGGAPASAADRPMTAASDRLLGGSPAAAGIDLEALKAGLVRDLIGQLRDEFERGG
jgi:hypothetical protein